MHNETRRVVTEVWRVHTPYGNCCQLPTICRQRAALGKHTAQPDDTVAIEFAVGKLILWSEETVATGMLADEHRHCNSYSCLGDLARLMRALAVQSEDQCCNSARA
eukprot:6930725-Prymnesium_polylepis.1